MKITILLFSAFCFGICSTYAQVNQGRIQVGGSLSAYGVKEKNTFNPENKSANVNVSPSVGFFYKTNKLAGLFLNFGYGETRNFNTGESISRGYGGGIYFRQYQPVVNKLYVFFNESGAYNYVSGETNGNKTHYYTINAALQTGLAYDITRKMQLELSLNNLVNAYYQNGALTRGYGISTSLEKDVFSNIGFGFRYFLK